MDRVRRFKVTIFVSNGVYVQVRGGYCSVKPLSANPTKWSNTLKQFVGKSRIFNEETSPLLETEKESSCHTKSRKSMMGLQVV